MPPVAGRVRIEDKLFLIRYKTDDRSHLRIIDSQVCLGCRDKPCTKFCPADVYRWDADQAKIMVAYEGCVECGSCRIGCPYYNIEWVYPRGGFGVNYKYG